MTHYLTIEGDDDRFIVTKIECAGDCGAGEYDDGDWPDATTCRCEDPLCPCRDGDHGGCSEYGGYIFDLGDECRCHPTGRCWYVSLAEAIGGEGFDFSGITLRLEVDIVGRRPDDAAVVTLAKGDA